MKQYVDLITDIIENGVNKSDRTGTGTISTFGYQNKYDLREGFPLLTLKKTHFKSIVHENLWFLQGGTNTKYLQENGVKIWNEWADKNGDLGPVYGKQWVNWNAPDIKQKDFPSIPHKINQIQVAVDKLKTNPDDRGIIVSAWNAGELDEMALRPCHAFFQFYTSEIKISERYKLFNEWVKENNKEVSGMGVEDAMEHYDFPKRYISMKMFQRSADVFLGVPFNIAGYSLLLHMFGQVVNMIPKEFIHSFGDAHLYSNHKEQVNELLSRTFEEGNKGDKTSKFWSESNYSPNIGSYMGPKLPKLKIAKKDSIFDYKFEDFELIDYKPLSLIKAPVAI